MKFLSSLFLCFMYTLVYGGIRQAFVDETYDTEIAQWLQTNRYRNKGLFWFDKHHSEIYNCFFMYQGKYCSCKNTTTDGRYKLATGYTGTVWLKVDVSNWNSLVRYDIGEIILSDATEELSFFNGPTIEYIKLFDFEKGTVTGNNYNVNIASITYNTKVSPGNRVARPKSPIYLNVDCLNYYFPEGFTKSGYEHWQEESHKKYLAKMQENHQTVTDIDKRGVNATRSWFVNNILGLYRIADPLMITLGGHGMTNINELSYFRLYDQSIRTPDLYNIFSDSSEDKNPPCWLIVCACHSGTIMDKLESTKVLKNDFFTYWNVKQKKKGLRAVLCRK